MSSGGHVASSSGCVTRPKEQEIGSTGYTVPTQYSLLIGRYVMATAEHREPCDSRGSCTVLGAPGGEIPPGDSTARAVPNAKLSDREGSTRAVQWSSANGGYRRNPCRYRASRRRSPHYPLADLHHRACNPSVCRIRDLRLATLLKAGRMEARVTKVARLRQGSRSPRRDADFVRTRRRCSRQGGAAGGRL